MSYSTRRSGGYAQQPQQNVASIGQRRPAPTNNFVPGGQLTPQKGGSQQQQPQQQQRANQNTGAQVRNQQQQQQTPTKQQQMPVNKPPLQQQSPAPKPQPPQLKQQTPLPKPQPTPVKKETSIPPVEQQQNVQQQQQPPPVGMESIEEQPNLENGNDENMETGEGKKKPFWARTGNKISKREKVRRRNVRLSKMLQPKNAVMILNELVKNTTYTVEEMSLKMDGNQFKATVLVEDMQHIGYGRSKIHAKNAAAEVALKHFIKYNKMTEKKEDDDGDEQMEISEEEASKPLPWQHVASFALFKLFTSWGEDPNMTQSQMSLNSSSGERQHENRPAKKMPDNPETVNPLMLVNQMLPQAQFEEIGKSGNPPNVTFSYKCIVDEHSFVGTGPNKKAAKKMAAFGACHKVLGITYPLDVYVPIY